MGAGNSSDAKKKNKKKRQEEQSRGLMKSLERGETSDYLRESSSLESGSPNSPTRQKNQISLNLPSLDSKG